MRGVVGSALYGESVGAAMCSLPGGWCGAAVTDVLRRVLLVVVFVVNSTVSHSSS